MMSSLPGYEAQIAEDGLEHSRKKIHEAGKELCTLFIHNSCQVLHEAPCTIRGETLGYRCRCTFQLVKMKGKFEYAMRTNQKVIPIATFPIALKRIQIVMSKLLGCMNEPKHDIVTFLSRQPSSIAFASSWDGSDCVVTVNYGEPLPDTSSVEETAWYAQAGTLRALCNIQALTGRSRKRKLVSKDTVDDADVIIRDTISISLSEEEGNFCTVKGVYLGDSVYADETVTAKTRIIPIKYEKPEDAFQHPNGHAMRHALKWILNCISFIANEIKEDSVRESCRIGLLEMYCGCGAHSVPIAKSGLVDYVAAVELDLRLIKACQNNCKLNGIEAQFNTDGRVKEKQPDSCTLQLFHGDAGRWADKSRQSRKQKIDTGTIPIDRSQSWYDQDFLILMVDPPRAGLDNHVCRMAVDGPFEHLIYISCGREALNRDLRLLGDASYILDCTLIDLFPRTDSIESLVHLRRRKFPTANEGVNN